MYPKGAIDGSLAQITDLREEIDLDRLAQPDRARLDAAAEIPSTVDVCLEGYNQEFLKTERERYRDLFIDIGPANLELTPTQQRAVIRNDMWRRLRDWPG